MVHIQVKDAGHSANFFLCTSEMLPFHIYTKGLHFYGTEKTVDRLGALEIRVIGLGTCFLE